MAPRIKVAAVGLGWVALHRHLPVMDRGGQFEVVGVVDRQAGRAEAVARQRGYRRSARALGKITGIDAVQLGNPRRRLPEWYEELPLGLFYDESPHLLYLMQSIAGPLRLARAIAVPSRRGLATPARIAAWFTAAASDY